jgi:hypothetical protein
VKKKTRTIVIAVSVFLLGMLALAPFLFHKRTTAGSNDIVASRVEPGKVQAEEPTRTNPPARDTAVKLQEPAVKTVPKPVSKPVSNQDLPVAKASIPEPVKTTPQNSKPVLRKKIQPKMNEDKLLAGKNNQLYIEKKPAIPKQGLKAEPDSPATAAVPEKPSPWGVYVIAASSGVDGGVSCGLFQIPLFKGIDLDLMAGIKQAGLGLSKYVYRNVGLGVAGTITYGTGAKNIGIYGKYSF